jgi:hypothetical protein
VIFAVKISCGLNGQIVWVRLHEPTSDSVEKYLRSHVNIPSLMVCLRCAVLTEVVFLQFLALH